MEKTTLCILCAVRWPLTFSQKFIKTDQRNGVEESKTIQDNAVDCVRSASPKMK